MERTGHRPVAPPYATHRSGVDFWLVSEADSVARHARFPTALATLSWPFCYVQIAQDDNQPPYENDHSLVGGFCKEENEKKKIGTGRYTCPEWLVRETAPAMQADLLDGPPCRYPGEERAVPNHPSLHRETIGRCSTHATGYGSRSSAPFRSLPSTPNIPNMEKETYGTINNHETCPTTEYVMLWLEPRHLDGVPYFLIPHIFQSPVRRKGYQ